jgi:aminoglycoside phosphotransferase family enzyme/predicted kinase
MHLPPAQQETVAFLRELAGADPVETHISFVFIGADTVWKLKKAVRLPFLDFTNLAARRHFAERELALNSAAAPGLYRDVVAVVRRANGSLSFGEGEDATLPAVDWLLRMARVPSADFLDVMASTGRLDPPLLDALADAVAAYHAQCPVVDVDIAESMRNVTRGNACSARAAGMPEAEVAAWEQAELALLDRLAPWQTKRVRGGFVRRAHGDLHLGNLCLWQGKPAPFDALEFDERMASIDLGYDLAFLLMDLDRRASRAAANRVLNRYVARTGDAAFTRALPPYLSQRAMVLAHVWATRHRPELSQAYLVAALAYLRPHPAFVAAIAGLQGSGKSTLARALAPDLGAAPGALILRSDEIRKRQHGAAPEQRLPSSAYTEAASNAVFAALADTAEHTAAHGHAVIADGTFIDPAHRRAIETAARRAGVPFIGMWLDAPMPVLEGRLASRSGDASDATVSVLRAAARAKTIPPRRWLVLDATDRELPARARAAVLASLSHSAEPC